MAPRAVFVLLRRYNAARISRAAGTAIPRKHQASNIALLQRVPCGVPVTASIVSSRGGAQSAVQGGGAGAHQARWLGAAPRASISSMCAASSARYHGRRGGAGNLTRTVVRRIKS